jgi:hypothetical protein
MPRCTVHPWLLLLALGCEPEAEDRDSAGGDTSTPDTAPDTGPADSADSAGDSDSDTDTTTDTTVDTDTGEPTEACVPTSDAAVTLCADRFWAQDLDATTRTELDAAIAAMPEALRVQGLSDDVARAQQLQWALVAANALSAASVSVLLPDGTYDFTGLDDAHASLPAEDFYQQPLKPKLFVGRDDVSLRRASAAAEPILTATGPGADGIHHGRVFLLLDSSATGLLVEGLVFRGDADSATFTDPAYALHENDAALCFRGQWGAAMVGLNGGANHATFDECRFEQVNGNGISAVGLLTVMRSVFEGAVPDAEVADPEDATEALFDAILAERGTSPGMDFHAGIRRAYAYGPTVVEESSFSGFVQGVLTAADGFSVRVADSTFTSIYDHAVYVLGDADSSVIERNTFERVGNGAVKFAGHTDEPDPSLSTAGLHDGAIRDNRFLQMRNGAMQLSGVRNEIARNEVVAYDPAADPTGWYDPDYRPGHHYPDAFLITEGGQSGWANHIANNRFEENVATGGSFDIFVQQRTTVPDRSIEGNEATGSGQTLYFHHLRPCDTNPAPCSDYPPEVTVGGGTTLVVGAPEDCADCYPEDERYLTTLP